MQPTQIRRDATIAVLEAVVAHAPAVADSAVLVVVKTVVADAREHAAAHVLVLASNDND